MRYPIASKLAGTWRKGETQIGKPHRYRKMVPLGCPNEGQSHLEHRKRKDVTFWNYGINLKITNSASPANQATAFWLQFQGEKRSLPRNDHKTEMFVRGWWRTPRKIWILSGQTSQEWGLLLVLAVRKGKTEMKLSGNIKDTSLENIWKKIKGHFRSQATPQYCLIEMRRKKMGYGIAMGKIIRSRNRKKHMHIA